MMMKKRLYKDNSDKKICGVCSGIAKYFDIDPTLVRLGWAIFVACAGTGLLAYIICAIVMPDEPGYIDD
jgi:phage shock protein PspC (stress-responsive transcriptional regulator)